jgi:stage II sporulation protein AA (anti-sigma F factor antagonist)
VTEPTEPTAVRTLPQGDAARVWIAVDGDIDLATAARVEAEILAAIDNRATTVTVDLTNVDYLDSAGLRVVFRLATRLTELRTDLEVVAPPGSISRRVIELSGFDGIGTLRP